MTRRRTGGGGRPVGLRRIDHGIGGAAAERGGGGARQRRRDKLRLLRRGRPRARIPRPFRPASRPAAAELRSESDHVQTVRPIRPVLLQSAGDLQVGVVRLHHCLRPLRRRRRRRWRFFHLRHRLLARACKCHYGICSLRYRKSGNKPLRGLIFRSISKGGSLQGGLLHAVLPMFCVFSDLYPGAYCRGFITCFTVFTR